MGLNENVQAIWTATDRLRRECQEPERASLTLALSLLRRLAYTSESYPQSGFSGSGHPGAALVDWLKTLPEDARMILDGLGVEHLMAKFEQIGMFKGVLDAIAQMDLHPDRVTDAEMADTFDALVTHCTEQFSPDGSEHSTPADVNMLMASLLLAGDLDALQVPGVARTIFDPACGRGGTLSAVEGLIAGSSPDAAIEVFGQDINVESVAICRARRFLRGGHVDTIKLGNSLTEDQHGGLKADYVVSSPPFGLSWKSFEAAVRHEHETMGVNGRFGPGLPRRSDSTLLFLLHMLSKMKPAEEGGSRLVLLTAGASLWAGDAGSGESDIRRHVIESDLLEGIIALPANLLENTAIPTYAWVVTNRKRESRRGHVRIIDGAEFFEASPQQRRRRRVGEAQIDELLRLFNEETDSSFGRTLRNDDFAFVQLNIEDRASAVPLSTEAAATLVELPLSTRPEEYLTIHVLPKRPSARIKDTVVGYAVRRIEHLGFELARALAVVEQQYQTCALRPLQQVCLTVEPRRAPRSEREGMPPDALSLVPGLQSVRVVPDESVVSAEYLAMFFATDLGKKLLSALELGSVPPAINASVVGKLPIPVPTLAEQLAVLESKRRIEELGAILSKVESELAANPGNVSEVNQRVVPLLQALGQLSEADELRQLIRGGESKRLEFKQTLSLDIRKQTKESYIEESALKTIVAFLNSDGGDLLVGVHDRGVVLGVTAEVEKFYQSDTDKFLLHFKNLLRRIGEQHYPLINQRLVVVGGAQVLWVRCVRSAQPVFLDDDFFFVRTNPATDKLTGRKMTEYIRNRFE